MHDLFALLVVWMFWDLCRRVTEREPHPVPSTESQEATAAESDLLQFRRAWLPKPKRIDEIRWAFTDFALAEKASFYSADLGAGVEDVKERREKATSYRVLLESMLEPDACQLVRDCVRTIDELVLAQIEPEHPQSRALSFEYWGVLEHQLRELASLVAERGYHIEWFLTDLLVLYVERDSHDLSLLLRTAQRHRSSDGSFQSLITIANRMITVRSQA